MTNKNTFLPLPTYYRKIWMVALAILMANIQDDAQQGGVHSFLDKVEVAKKPTPLQALKLFSLTLLQYQEGPGPT